MWLLSRKNQLDFVKGRPLLSKGVPFSSSRLKVPTTNSLRLLQLIQWKTVRIRGAESTNSLKTAEFSIRGAGKSLNSTKNHVYFRACISHLDLKVAPGLAFFLKNRGAVLGKNHQNHWSSRSDARARNLVMFRETHQNEVPDRTLRFS